MKRTDKPLNDRLKPLQEEQKAIAKAAEQLSVPPTRKYEPDGGPGMRQILDLLKASDEPEADQTLFLKAQIVFWLLGATDGHAKNFSIFLLPAFVIFAGISVWWKRR